jgi:hypothetical protein
MGYKRSDKMLVIKRSKLVKMSNDMQCNEIDTLRTLKIGNPELIIKIVEDTTKFPYSFELRHQLKEELNYDYIP